MVYLISFLELFVGISCYFYGFIKCFKVSLHLVLLHWNVTMILERILVWRFMVCVVEMVHGGVALQEGYGVITDDIQRIDWWEVFMWCYRHYQLIYCLCGTVGTWVKVPKALEEGTPMWVYGVGPAPGF